ncbi:MAG: glycosyltransferase [Acidobacteriota bacterium]|nr:glycosyltransferase [Acidobacteriota bacterium]
MRVAVVIPTCRRPDGLEACLSNLERPGGLKTDVIVVENGSSVGAEIAERHGARYFNIGPASAAIARNFGIKEAGDVTAVALLDDDVIPNSGWLERIVAPIVAGQASATIGGVHVVTDADASPTALGMFVDTSVALNPAKPFLAGLNMAIDPRVFEEVGGFRTELGPGALGAGGEDILLGLMLTESGYGIQAVPDAKVDHIIPSNRFTTKALEERAFAGGQSSGWILHHWHGVRYRLLPLRVAKAWLEQLVPRNMSARLAAIERYGTLRQLQLESGKPSVLRSGHP